MSGETKSQGQKDKLDRFYTPLEIASKCVSLLDLSKYDCIIEPSAGTGNFLTALNSNLVYGYDIAPASSEYNIIEADWLKLDKTQFKSFKSILVIGNPPFGQQNNLAVNFFNESARFSNTIAFILPLSFKKDSVQNRLDLNFHLVKELNLQECEFLLLNEEKVTVPCVFQIWERKEKPRTKVKLKTTSQFFSFVEKTSADFRIQRVGGNAGKASFDLTKSPSSNYFIKNLSELSNEDFVNKINNLIFPSIAFTVGPKSLSKGEMISVIEENLFNREE